MMHLVWEWIKGHLRTFRTFRQVRMHGTIIRACDMHPKTSHACLMRNSLETWIALTTRHFTKTGRTNRRYFNRIIWINLKISSCRKCYWKFRQNHPDCACHMMHEPAYTMFRFLTLTIPSSRPHGTPDKPKYTWTRILMEIKGYAWRSNILDFSVSLQQGSCLLW